MLASTPPSRYSSNQTNEKITFQEGSALQLKCTILCHFTSLDTKTEEDFHSIHISKTRPEDKVSGSGHNDWTHFKRKCY